MKKVIAFFLTFLIIFSYAHKLNAQDNDSIVIRTIPIQTSKTDYSWVNFTFFDLESKKQIKVAAVNIKGVKVVSDITTGKVRIALLPKKYKIWVNSPFFHSSKTFTLKTYPKNNFDIEIYLTQSKEPLHEPVD